MPALGVSGGLHSSIVQALSWPGLALLAISMQLAGCVHYVAAPLAPAEILEVQQQQAIDTDRVRRQLAQIAPDSHWDGRELNALSLFAAAMVYNPEIKRARATATAAAAASRAARVAPGPNIGLTTEYAVDAAGAPAWVVGIASDLLLDIGARRHSRITRAELDARMALADFAGTAWATRMRIQLALIEHRMADREAAMARKLIHIREQQLATIQQRLAAGVADMRVVALVQTALAAAQQSLAAIAAQQTAAMLKLAAAVGVPAAAIDPSALADAATTAKMSLPAAPAELQRASALLERSDVQRSLLAYAQTEAELQTAIAAQYPEIRLGPSYQSDQGVSKIGIGLGLSFPSLDFNQAAIRSAQSRRLEAAQQVAATIAAAAAAAAQSQDHYQATRSALALARDQSLPAARALAKQADAAFANGVINRADLAAAQADWQMAQLAAAQALQRTLEALADMENALQQPLTGPELSIIHKPSPAGVLR